MSTSIIPYERSTLVNNEKYIGLDVHQATIWIAVMDSTGKVVMESILETKAATILEFFADADRFLQNLRERLGKFGLELHPDKTRRIEFGRFAEQNRRRRGEDKPETFDFLGLTHISGKNRLGRFTVRRK